jgi:hypothetical protein
MTDKKNKGLEILGRKGPITKEMWVELILARAELIKPFLENFTLEKLEDIRCVKKRDRMERIGQDGPMLLDSSVLRNKYSLRTQGIFNGESSGLPVFSQNGKKYIWGLTRDGKWIIAEIIIIPGSNGEFAQRVNINEVSFTKIVEHLSYFSNGKETEHLVSVWQYFGEIIFRWQKKSKKIADAVSSSADIIIAEEAAMVTRKV